MKFQQKKEIGKFKNCNNNKKAKINFITMKLRF